MNENQVFSDAMLDLETLGTNPGDAVVSVGIQMFNLIEGVEGPLYRVNLDMEEVLAVGFGVTGATLKWWFGQTAEARRLLTENATGLDSGLMAVVDIFTDGEDGVNNGLKVWGNGAAFDNVLLREMFRRRGLMAPWEFWNDRCFRTIRNQHPDPKSMEPEFVGERHDAAADARHQARWLMNMYHGRLLEFADPESHQLSLDLEGEE